MFYWITIVTQFCQAHSNEVTSECARVQRSLDDFVDDKVDSSAMGWTESVDELMRCVDRGVEEQEDLIKATQSTVCRYVSEELKKDLPTG